MAQRKTRMGQLVDAAARASQQTTGRFRPATVRNVTLLAFVLAVVGMVWGLSKHIPFHIVFGFAALFLGVVSGWSQLSFLMNQSAAGASGRAARGRAVGIAMTVVSIVVTIIGVVMLFVGILSPSSILYGALAGFAMILAVSLIVAPWWITLVANLGAQEAQTAREQVRLDFTSRLHDSVLQTLALIQINAADSAKVAALAHAQERDLREWLYGDADAESTASQSAPGDRPSAETMGSPLSARPGESFAHHIKRVAASVEDSTERQIEVVAVGDCPSDAQLSPLVAASREAMLNAAHHGKPPYSVYVEVSGDLAQVFVRDHGEGFDTTRLPAGHLGVSESILGRMKRSGGTADIDSRRGWGTEVKLAQHIEGEKRKTS
ncbi:MAG: ATP-binding protein [Bifidobacteriaceae bacterium]|jgi:signal transduction histidine kinase|nr:ATP-binding protein [Bifidobacteriaceae bacterium]MCI1915471.1 ATP-binding protein [Bifidobacteriaceae bacterium]